MDRNRQERSRPLMVYDGDCGFCKFWVDRWRGTTGDRVDYEPYQKVADEFPGIPEERFATAVQLIRPDGSVVGGAEAVFEALGHTRRRWRWVSRLMNVGVIRRAAGAVYRTVARHRTLLSALNRMAFGRSMGVPGYAVGRVLFVRGMGLVYFLAFLSLAVQVRGLIGRRGILPAGEFLEMVAQRLGPERFRQVPTLFWLNSGDAALFAACVAGMVGGILAMFGVLPTAALVMCWLLYLSLLPVGQQFLGYQWDVLLVEAGVLAVLVAMTHRGARTETWPGRVARWLVLWLLFRLMFESGAIKLMSGDLAWRDFSALRYHYETQPLPVWVSWYAHSAPGWVHSTSGLAMFAVELGAPFLILGPRMFRRVGFGAIAGLQAGIAATGNYGFFNLLGVVICLPLLDDDAWPAWVRGRIGRSAGGGGGWWPMAIVAPVAAVQLVVGGAQIRSMLDRGWHWPKPVVELMRMVAPMRLVNSYGLFAVMTKERPEIVIEGSRDGGTWKRYDFKWKPGALTERPRFVAPHQPRLDWQMWFAALGTPERNGWVLRLMQRLMEGEPAVLELLRTNPFPDEPPRYLRAVLYDYRFTRPGEGSGEWWKREELGYYLPVLEREARY